MHRILVLLVPALLACSGLFTPSSSHDACVEGALAAGATPEAAQTACPA